METVSQCPPYWVLDLSRASLHEVLYHWELWIKVVLYIVKIFKY